MMGRTLLFFRKQPCSPVSVLTVFTMLRPPLLIPKATLLMQIFRRGGCNEPRLPPPSPYRPSHQALFDSYKILAAQEMAKEPEDQQAAGACFSKINMDKELFRLGHTKVSDPAHSRPPALTSSEPCPSVCPLSRPTD